MIVNNRLYHTISNNIISIIYCHFIYGFRILYSKYFEAKFSSFSVYFSTHLLMLIYVLLSCINNYHFHFNGGKNIGAGIKHE